MIAEVQFRFRCASDAKEPPSLASIEMRALQDQKIMLATRAATRFSACRIQSRSMSTSVYMWAKMPRLGSKSGNLKLSLEMPKGTPKRVEAFDGLGVAKLRIGLRHSAAVCENGDLYTFGNGNWGVLGHGSEDNINFNKPRLVETLKKAGVRVRDVALGEYHTLVLGEDGSVWTWGYGGKKGFFNWMYSQEVGALGHGDKEAYFWPKCVDFFKGNEVEMIAAGNYHCVAVTKDQKLYSWGRGLYGVLGNGSNRESLTPLLNEEFEYQRELAEAEADANFGFLSISAADDYSGAIMRDGSLQMWGKNDRGQMGVGSGVGIDMIESENTPTEVNLEDALSASEREAVVVREFSAGQNTMVIRDSKNRVYKTGLKIDYTPKLVAFNEDLLPKEKISQIACGRAHYVVLDTDNNLHTNGKVFSGRAELTHDGFEVHDGDELFNEGRVRQLSMNYEMFGALVDER